MACLHLLPVPLCTDLRWRIVWLLHYKELDSKDIADLLYMHIATVRRIISLFDTSGDVSQRAIRLDLRECYQNQKNTPSSG